MSLTRVDLRVFCEPGRAAARQVRTAAGEDRRSVVGIEEAVAEDDDGLPAVLEERDGLCPARESTIALRASS